MSRVGRGIGRDEVEELTCGGIQFDFFGREVLVLTVTLASRFGG